MKKTKNDRYIEQRDKKILDALNLSIKFLNLEDNLKHKLAEALLKEYMPDDQRIKEMVKIAVLDSAKSIESLGEAINIVIKGIVYERFKNLQKEYVDEIKEVLIDNIRNY